MEPNEQKAKAYDAVLERVKDMYTHTANGYAKQIMEKIFPELKESKSERIRWEIIEFLKKQRQQTFVPYEWTDWLKEQKEFVSADFDEVWDALDTGWNAQINGISKDVLRAVCQKWFSKGVEIESKKRLEKQDEQKPVWSGEDETL